ncbi:hypothetical protein A2526_04920 [candidate division WOR-1 bacterium RIFOXYD2_FULL_36_8]|uniref:KilA-N DNA-binding domain-containing protein n=1 Tax=candidate division WOR-1 bacterium RIFOXYB2_FULL_36_35 TaxID=1802578 RepID=A0A1F4S2J7_UNCSA|nr:MAG: hypothetical protein A2230_04420 [candidate division WOR-1 bacterium RIFOXYA2_FULL_36_21]OGC14638.1 MAG: hypothetical protein A2290_01150 [candidate division WOR-1 bacterium RIFOXYB2_FULL_36_35]OGC19656.1 MAG: hypothetical protein A2282_02875 [candidate division WOR-1 bacterium RIFOXYA12_FULL_36_13]OGC41382.1 MAG: hypothetical protein A2526_04920 [candidate division WOR-1 bacterium RIFOXYD2_FULL_36_8]
MKNLIPVERIENKIYLIRGQRVMLDKDIANLYGIKTFVLNQAVKRNLKRFPSDFMFKLGKIEAEWLVSQNVIPHKKYFGGHLPYVFSENGVAMLSSVLKSEKAVEVNIQIMRTFTKLRNILSESKELSTKLEKLEERINSHDKEIVVIFEAIRRLMALPEKPKTKIGFISPTSKFFDSEGKRIKLKLIILILLFPFFLSACNPSDSQVDDKEKKREALNQENEIVVDQPSEETVSQKPVFLYSKQMGNIISLKSEPVETLLGFARVAGVIYGTPSRALIEIGGKGALVARGEDIGPYKVERISEKEVILCLGK